VRRVALLVPYREGLAELIRGYLLAHDIEPVACATFDLAGDPEMNRVPASAILEAGLAIGAHPDAEGLFVSCTGLRTRDLVAELEVRLGRPVVTSNQAQAWALLRAAGRADRPGGRGSLFLR
jgi:maleate isomerase